MFLNELNGNVSQGQLLTLLQLLDSGFPTGGFSHSQGLEAWLHHSISTNARTSAKKVCSEEDSKLKIGFTCILENAGSFGLPFVRESFQAANNETRLIELDRLCHANMANHVAAKASTRQGQSFLESTIYVFKTSLPMSAIKTLENLPHCHMEVVHGVLMALLGFEPQTSQSAYMYGILRTAISAAVRLDVLGAMEGQKLEQTLAQDVPGILQRNEWREASDASIKFPVLDIFQNTQDTLFCKLFFS